MNVSDIDVLEVRCVKLCRPASVVKTVRDSLEFVLEFSKSPSKWVFQDYKAGLEGYDYWINALSLGNYDKWGAAYNAAVWYECRKYAVDFLRETRLKLNVSGLIELLEEAEKYYKVVAENFRQVSLLFPFPPKRDVSKEAREKAVQNLRKARRAEGEGLKVLSEILEKLEILKV